MKAEDYLVIKHNAGALSVSVRELNYELVEKVHSGKDRSIDDLEAAVALARFVHDEFKEKGTSGALRVNNEDSQRIMLALVAVLRRLGIDFTPPFINFDDFCKYWKNAGAVGSGSWQARRDMLSELFDPIHARLADRQVGAMNHELADAVSPCGRTGWSRVDEEIVELRRLFALADSSAAYSAVGNASVRVLEAVSEVAYDVSKYLRDGEDEPSVQETKNRFDRIIEVELVGKDSSKMRSLFKAAVGLAHSVKHSTSPTKTEAGISADVVILLANIMRRIRSDID